MRSGLHGVVASRGLCPSAPRHTERADERRPGSAYYQHFGAHGPFGLSAARALPKVLLRHFAEFVVTGREYVTNLSRFAKPPS
jgi:hypothetical protein